jgi:hypothetical protein
MKKILAILFFIWFYIPVKAQTPLFTAVDFTVTDLENNTFNLFNTLNSNKYVLIDFFYCS